MPSTRGLVAFAVLAAAFVAAQAGGGCANSSLEGGLGGAPAIRIETHVSANAVELGGRFDVSCQLLDPRGNEVAGAATFDVAPGTFSLDGLAVIPDEAGAYLVTCSQVDGDLVDETPEVVTVTAPDTPSGGPTVRTRVTGEMPACWQTVVACDVLDRDGDPIPNAATLVTVEPVGGAPTDGVEIVGHQLTARSPGDYVITCALTNGALVDVEPPVLTVVPALPAEVVTAVEPELIAPGGSAEVTCTVIDGCGDPMEGLDTLVEADPGLTLDGLTVSADEVGRYEIACHLVQEAKPPTRDSATELVVREPPPPVVRIELRSRPEREVYAPTAAVQVFGVAFSEDGRIVEGAPITIEVPEGMIHEGGYDYRFDGDGAYTFRGSLDEDPSITDELTLYADSGPPELVIFSPERGDTFDTGLVPVTGYVSDINGAGSLTVNGVDIPLAEDGSFDYAWPADYGLNVLWFTARDTFGRSVRTSRAFYYSSDWVQMDPVDSARLTDSVLLFLGQEGLDDGDHDPAHIDDIATVLELLLDSLIDIESLLGSIGGGTAGGPISLYDNVFENIVYWPFQLLGIQFELRGDLYLTVEIEQILVGDWSVSALYRDGGIDLILGIAGAGPDDAGLGAILGVTLAFDVEAGFYRPLNGEWVGLSLDPPPSVHTQTSAYLHGVFLELGIDADMPPGGDLTVAVSDLRVTIEDIDINPLEDLILDFGGIDLPIVGHIDLPAVPLTGLVQGINGLIGDSLIDPILNWAVTGLSDLISPLVSQAATMLVEQIVDLLVLDLDLPLPQLPGAQGAVTLHFSAAPSSVTMVPDGGTFGLGASLTSEKQIDRDPHGSILRDGCAGADPASLVFDPATPMQASFLLDFVNEAIFSLWWGGGINLDLDLGALGGLGGVANGIVGLEFLLPPILTDCTEGGWAELQIGDLYLDLNGSAVGFSGSIKAWVSVRLGVELTASGNTIGLTVPGQPSIELEIVEVTGMLATFESLIPGLIQSQLIPLLVDGINGSLGAIPIPEIDLGGLLPNLPPGTALRLGNLRAGSEHGYVLVGGELQ